METPRTLMEAVRYFSDEARTFEMAKTMRWPNGVHCPECGRADVRFIATRKLWECKEKHAKRQFSVKRGTIFEDSALPLDKWFVAMWSIANCKNGISSYELARAIGVTQKSAWHMLHRIRLAMRVDTPEIMAGTVEADETYIGGKLENMHAHKKAALLKGTAANKEIVMGVLERSGDRGPSRAHVRHIRTASAKHVQAHVRSHVEQGAALMTDSAWAYKSLGKEYAHQFVNHAVEYVRGTVHTNGIENFWSLLKRTLKGTYVSVDPMHLARYLDEQAFRFNERKDSDFGRFTKALGSISGRRLTYKDLITHAHA